ncbi:MULTISPECIES: TRAP transporter large permease [Dethiosulfovibrio]|uniref:TRAP transporter large permease subunit n=2 Tax=Dethiosulfovibrio TaxID=47054 RepID=A0ABS9EL80_9BACT|nr:MULTISPECIES: TRAP transporter large permease subunit [Dethiosulfovibrio]MCF4113503.1 TRAP transporter large permease subunit [Dethiosulfovibrio russensis]MCF4141973.1 TRAP transporter large permease subunit [Dethiosulfovibrio marinus]MCF4144128.1 TRAP transporter large permease subunit [Dethiosulfovibrio acidaminovorans]
MLICTLLAALFGSVPIFIALNGAVLICVLLFTHMPPMVIVQKAFGGIDKFALMSMPFFIFAANVMDVGGLSRRILDWTRSMVGSTRGGLAYTTQATCMVFGALCGSSPATVVAMGKLLYPELVRESYPKGFSVGLITSAGSVALIIPPSITLIIYAAATGTSVGSLFMAGISAGVVYGLASIIYIWFFSRSHNLALSAPSSRREIWEKSKQAVWSLMVPVIILGGIYMGIFTPTEAAGISVVYALFVGIFIYREITLKGLYDVCLSSAITCAQVLILVAAAQTFGWFLTVVRIPQAITSMVVSNVTSPWVFLGIINAVLLVVGMFMEGIAAIIILAPLFFPIAMKMGIDPLHLGIVMVANLSIGNFTPPFGLNLFVASGVTGLPMSEIIPAVMRFILVSLAGVLIITYIPAISTFLPKLVYP